MTTQDCTLKGEKAIALWKAGREAWNQWEESHPEWDVNFRGVDSLKYRSECPQSIISLEGYKFPSRTID